MVDLLKYMWTLYARVPLKSSMDTSVLFKIYNVQENYR